jgi:hypothetical protein
VQALEDALRAIGAGLPAGLPDCMPILHHGLAVPAPVPAPPVEPGGQEDNPPLVALLARVLGAWTREHEQAAGLSLAIGANLLRLVPQEGLAVRDLPSASGVSKEAMAMALGFLERRKMAHITSEGRLRTVRLAPAGVEARARCTQLGQEIEERWSERIGAASVQRLRGALEQVVAGTTGEALLRAVAASSEGGWRAAAGLPRRWPWQPMVLHRGGYPDGA